MIFKVLSVRDSKSEAFATPFYAPTIGHAVRSFSTAANDPVNDISKFSDDFTLFELGEFDDRTGDYAPLPHGPKSLGLASQFINS